MKKVVYWTPRVLAILFTLFIMMFSLDVFDGTSSIVEQLIGFLMHNLPAFGIILIIALSWKKDYIGIIGFAVIAIGLFLMVTRSMPPEGICYKSSGILHKWTSVVDLVVLWLELDCP